MKAAKFALVGAAGFVVDALVFYVLTQIGLGILPARFIAFWIAATVTWLGNKHFTFACQQKAGLVVQWLKHMASAHGSGAANLVSFYLLSWIYPVAIAFVLGVLVGAVFNYWLSDKFVFRQAN